VKLLAIVVVVAGGLGLAYGSFRQEEPSHPLCGTAYRPGQKTRLAFGLAADIEFSKDLK
jgi:hypothetical protein